MPWPKLKLRMRLSHGIESPGFDIPARARRYRSLVPLVGHTSHTENIRISFFILLFLRSRFFDPLISLVMASFNSFGGGVFGLSVGLDLRNSSNKMSQPSVLSHSCDPLFIAHIKSSVVKMPSLHRVPSFQILTICNFSQPAFFPLEPTVSALQPGPHSLIRCLTSSGLFCAHRSK